MRIPSYVYKSAADLFSRLRHKFVACCSDKSERWKFYTIFFSLTFFVFSIITTQDVESRQHVRGNGRSTAPGGIFSEIARFEKEIVIKSGETVASILNDTGIDKNEAAAIIEKLSPLYNLRYLQPGKKIRLVIYQNGENNPPVVELLKMEKSPGLEVRVAYRDGTYESRLVQVKTISVKAAGEGTITNSLYSDALQAGIPDAAIMEMFHLFSFDVDFQRDICTGDSFRVLYENIINMDGEVVSRGNIVFAELRMNGKDLKVYRFTGDDGKTDFFNEKGVNIRKTLLKTPIYGARISSRFGNREHPINGYTHFHQALDFAAPKDTPIIASGAGVVELADWNGGYGNCIIIQHSNQYKTLYAHLNAYANNVRRGKKVRQGEIIGYVGTTGVSTGYHLHYEVIFRGRRINPSTIKTPPEKKLTEQELERFFGEIDSIEADYIEAVSG